MNQAQRDAIQSAIGHMEGNLYRARLAKRGDSNWKSGNGEPIDAIIAGYERQLAALRGDNA